MTSDFLEADLTDLSWLISTRELSSTEVVTAALERLGRLEPKLNAFITVLDEQARAAAKAVDDEIAHGQHRGPLHGVPITIKDMFATSGVRTTGASKILLDWVPNFDAHIVERLDAAGAIIIGKTNLDEFGHGGTSTLSHFGAVHNPWNTERIAGGSSGGSAAAVAARIGPLSYGTETGSSVRRPASYCGIVGFKPTFGIISRYGSFRGAWSQDHVGIFARSVKDVALGLDATAGYDSRDPSSVQQHSPTYGSHLDGNVKGLRLAVPRRFLEGTESAVKEAFEVALKTLAEAGCVIDDLDIPELSYAAMTSMITSSAESAGINRRWFRERHQDFVPHVARGLAVGMTITASEYLTVQRARHRIREALHQAYKKIDLIVSPTTPRVAPPISDGVRGNGDNTHQASNNHSNLLRFPSMLGLPGCSVPCGMTPDKMPIGMQLIGAWFSDQTVLNAGLAYQSLSDWHRQKPPVDQ